MKLKINKYLLSIIFAVLIFTILPTTTFAEGLENINSFFGVTQQKTIINYEKSQPSSIDNPVVDPNFNVMRSKDTESSTATYIVIGLLIAATIIPLATWWYFSK
nr:fusion glycoprotein F0 [Prochlorococcus marinus]